MTPEQKRAKLKELLADNQIVQVLVRPRAPGVVLPKRAIMRVGAGFLKLHLTHLCGANWPLVLDEDGVHARIRVDGEMAHVVLPWDSIVGAKRLRTEAPRIVRAGVAL